MLSSRVKSNTLKIKKDANEGTGQQEAKKYAEVTLGISPSLSDFVQNQQQFCISLSRKGLEFMWLNFVCSANDSPPFFDAFHFISSLGEDLRSLVTLPEGEDINEWLAANSIIFIFFFPRFSLISHSSLTRLLYV